MSNPNTNPPEPQSETLGHYRRHEHRPTAEELAAMLKSPENQFQQSVNTKSDPLVPMSRDQKLTKTLSNLVAVILIIALSGVCLAVAAAVTVGLSELFIYLKLCHR